MYLQAAITIYLYITDVTDKYDMKFLVQMHFGGAVGLVRIDARYASKSSKFRFLVVLLRIPESVQEEPSEFIATNIIRIAQLDSYTLFWLALFENICIAIVVVSTLTTVV